MFNLSYIDLQVYIIFSIIIFTLVICFSARNNNKLVDENEKLRKRIKNNKEMDEYERKFIKESAILSERLRVSNEEFQKKCKEFIDKVEKVK